MKLLIRSAAVMVAAALLAVPAVRAAVDLELDGTEYSSAPGGIVIVQAMLYNPGSDPVFVSGLSTRIAPEFADSTLYDLFASAGPDSLMPGETWEGPLLGLRISPSAPITEEEAFVSIRGGPHPYADDVLAEAWFFVDDSMSISAAPPPPAGDTRLATAPNPFQGSLDIEITLPDAAQLLVSVYDVTGRLVRSLHSGELPSGTHRFTWDGRNAGGRDAGAGLFFLKASGAGRPLKTKVIRIGF